MPATSSTPTRADDSAAVVSAATLRRLPRLVRRHPELTVVLVLAVLLRVAVSVAYWPALMWDDSWAYLNTAFRNLPVSISGSRPSGYPLIVRVLSGNGAGVAGLVVVQHLAGLAIGVLVYVLALRMGVRRWLASLGVAVVLLDSYVLTLEQTLMPETFFTLFLLLSAYLMIVHRNRPGAVALSGALLAAAATVRTAALFAVPVWIWYLLGAPRDRRTIAAGALALALPLVGYCSAHALLGRGFTMTEADGWFLYGRVAALADCRSVGTTPTMRALCDPHPPGGRTDPTFYVYVPGSPAVRMFGHIGGRDGARSLRSDRILRQFAVAVIRDRPLAYAERVGRDYARMFTPGKGYVETAIVLPSRPRTLSPYESEARRNYLPDYNPSIGPPASALLAYQRVGHTPRWLLAILALVALATGLLPLVRRGAPRWAHRRESALLLGIALTTTLGAVMTVAAVVRYLVPAAPFLVVSGLAALTALEGRWQARGRSGASARPRTTSGAASPEPAVAGAVARASVAEPSG